MYWNKSSTEKNIEIFLTDNVVEVAQKYLSKY
jgi:hypothetical protein